MHPMFLSNLLTVGKPSKNVSMLPLSYLTCFAPLEVGKRSEWDRRMLSKNLKLPADAENAP